MIGAPMTHSHRLTAFFLLVATSLSLAFGQESATEDPIQYFDMTIYAFEGLQEVGDATEAFPDIVERSLEKVGAYRKYKGFRIIDQISWLVRTQENMDRFLDIPERWWALAEETNISFKLIYNFSGRYLTLYDFRMMIRQVPKIHTSAGLADGGAAVLGHSLVETRPNEVFFIVTLNVQDKPFPGQSENARFTVIPKNHNHH